MQNQSEEEIKTRKIKFMQSKKFTNNTVFSITDQIRQKCIDEQHPKIGDEKKHNFHKRCQSYKSLIDHKNNVSIMKNINIFSIEVCVNCQDHEEIHIQQKEDYINYNKYFLKIQDKIQKMFPKCQIVVNNNPRICAFEIRHCGNLIWSKLLFQKFPEIDVFENRLKNYYADYINKKNLTKYEYPDNNDNVKQLNLCYGSRIYGQQQISRSVQSSPQRKVNSNLIPNLFTQKNQIFAQNKDLNVSNIKKQMELKNFQNVLNKQQLSNSTVFATPNVNDSQSYIRPFTQEISTRQQTPSGSFVGSKRNSQSQENPKFQLQMIEQQQLMEKLEREEQIQQGLVYKPGGFSQSRFSQNDMPVDIVLEEYNTEEVGLPSFNYSEFQQDISDFWKNFKIYYVSFKYNPSIKRISLDIQTILKKIQTYISSFMTDFDKRNETIVSQQLKLKTIEKEHEDLLQNSTENEKILNHKIKMLEENVKELQGYNEQQMEDIKNLKLENQNEKNKFQSQLQELRSEITIKNKDLNEQKKNYEQQILDLKNKMMDEIKKRQSTNHMQHQIQQAAQKSLLDQRQQKIEYLEQLLGEKEKELDGLNEQKRSLQRKLSCKRGETETVTSKISEMGSVVDQLKKAHQNATEHLDKHKEEFSKKENSYQKQIKMLQNQLNMFTKQDYSTNVPKGMCVKLGMNFNCNDLSEIENLDLNCVTLNKLGDINEIINMDDPISKQNQIFYCGQTEGKVYDRDITMNLDSVKSQVKAIAIMATSKNNKNLKEFKNGILHHVIDGGISNLQTLKLAQGRVYLFAYYVKDTNNQWQYQAVDKSYPTFHIHNCIIDNLSLSGIRISENVRNSLRWDKGSGKLLKMKQGEQLPIPQAAYQDFIVGLGWDTGDTGLDIDSSVIMFRKNGELFDNVCFQNLKSKDGSVVHQGDERTGDVEGDDELIKLNLDKIHQDVSQLWIFICIYDDDQYFDSVEGAYCRFLAQDTEFCRFDLTQIREKGRNGVLMCDLIKIDNKWSIKGRGYFTQDTQCSDHVIPIIQKIQKGDLKDIKILQLQ